VYPFQQIKF